jgi:hypothetical protein
MHFQFFDADFFLLILQIEDIFFKISKGVFVFLSFVFSSINLGLYFLKSGLTLVSLYCVLLFIIWVRLEDIC